MANAADLFDSICEENLGVYRASVIRLREDASQEAQIANDYRGRLVYELLQNADDAMSGQETFDDRIVFRLTDTDLWVGNSGRPLDDADVKGLCGIGASRKGDSSQRRRASIGHKGMGFKSVLEITAAPEVVSETYSFKLGAELARPRIDSLMSELGHSMPKRVPAMRFPHLLHEPPGLWDELHGQGIRTLFRFPLRSDLTGEQRELLAQRLLDLPVTSILFLKHLERLEIVVDSSTVSKRVAWRLVRKRWNGNAWEKCVGLGTSGVYRIRIEPEGAPPHDFLLAHNADVEIGANRSGLDAYAWDGVELTEVSVAAHLIDGALTGIPDEWRHLHVFLPTDEPCPYPMLVNGAFVSDLSRKEIQVGAERTDYNRHLMHETARLFRDVLVKQLQREGASVESILSLLDREVSAPRAPAATGAGQALYEAMCSELGAAPLLPAGDDVVEMAKAVVPPLIGAARVGREFRGLLPRQAARDNRVFPDPPFCGTVLARIAVDHEACELAPEQAAEVLGNEVEPVALEDAGDGLKTDPVLRVLQGLWEGLGWESRDSFAAAVRRERLFPISVNADGVVKRVATAEGACFYPPRSLSGAVPLHGLHFLMRDVCWGNLPPPERNERLRDEMTAWQALFDIREFKFPDVMRASVLPALDLAAGDDSDRRREALRDPAALAAICQLSGRTPDPSRPLRYERLGTNRALFNLARLPVPCRAVRDGELEWQPAYRVYFGADWTGDGSVEAVLEAARAQAEDVPQIPLLAPPEVFRDELRRFGYLAAAAAEDEGTTGSTAATMDASAAPEDDEVSADEDEERPLEENELKRWRDFFAWIGVNTVLRPVHFHDVQERGSGWLQTKNLQRPEGWAFKSLKTELWDEFEEQARSMLASQGSEQEAVPYFYRVHDLEHIVPILSAAARDKTGRVASAVYQHLALNWSQLEDFVTATAAQVPLGQYPGMRDKPPRAREDEITEIGPDLWVVRLQQADWCPTTWGPRRPSTAWLRTPEVERRFGSQRSDAGQVVPLLETGDPTHTRARGLAQTVGIRVELTPSSFTTEDARLVLERLRDRYAREADAGTLTELSLRYVIRPTYRSLFELLTVGPPGSPAYGSGVLTGTPLLTHDARGRYRFEASDAVLYADRSNARERLGDPEDLWTFILEAVPAARAPLTRLFNVRVLEDELTVTPTPGDRALQGEELLAFRAGIREIAPAILARLSVERQEERLVSEDRRRLERFIEAVEPVDGLAVSYTLDGSGLGGTVPRDAYVSLPAQGEARAFVLWGNHAWPPASQDEREALATAVADALQSTHFEAILALISAGSDQARRKLLRMAGAPSELLAEDEPDDVGAQDPTLEKTSGEAPEEAAATLAADSDGSTAQARRTPLLHPEDLLIDGEPLAIFGDGNGGEPKRHSRSRGGAGGAQGANYGGRTDLDELDALGMYVAMTYERNRLRRKGHAEAMVLDAAVKEEQPNALVFDVSTVSARDAARSLSPQADSAFAALAAMGVSRDAPGFDILSLDPAKANGIDRLIELKSSGGNARLQGMTWNEWKTARQSDLRRIFFLYLVGNLRSDLDGATPFIKMIRDPFESVWAEEQHHQATSRKVQLNVGLFTQAELLSLGVRKPSQSATVAGQG